MVNRIEREMMWAEWEKWITGETGRCRQMETLLAEHATGRSPSQHRQFVHGNESTSIQTRFENYCHSCRRAHESIPDGALPSST